MKYFSRQLFISRLVIEIYIYFVFSLLIDFPAVTNETVLSFSYQDIIVLIITCSNAYLTNDDGFGV